MVNLMLFQNPTFKLLLCIALATGFSGLAKADIIATIGEYNGPAYDFSTTFPPSSQTIGTFTFNIPTGVQVIGVTISGTFGNNDIFSNTALSDYFVSLGMIQVAGCDDPSASCFSGTTGVPTPWSYSFTPTDLSNVAAALAAGSLDFTVVQNSPFTVQTGVTTLDIQVTPEPGTILIFCGGLAALATLRRIRKV